MAGQLAVVRETQNVEVHVAAAGVGVASLDEPVDQLDDLGDVPGRARLRRRRQHAEGVVGRSEGTLMGGAPLPPRAAGFGRLGEDLVVDVGDIADECDVVTLGHQPTPKDVEGDPTADMPDMRLALHGRAAQIDRDMTRAQRHQFAHRTAIGVVQTKAGGHDEAAYRDVSMIRAVATAAIPSPLPVNPSPSVVVADTDTGAPSRSEVSGRASSRRGPTFGRLAIT